MTEQEWLASRDPLAMVRAVIDKASERKIRLFACACCRRAWQVWEVAPSDEERNAVAIVERYVDGAATWEERTAALRALESPVSPGPVAMSARHLARSAIRAGVWLVALGASAAAVAVAKNSVEHSLADADPQRIEAARNEVGDMERQAQAAVLRDLIGPLLYRPPVMIPDSLTWRGGTTPQLARSIYEDRAFDRLPILADALEEAGCDNADLLGHLRGPGPHVRGCFAVDLVLAKG